MACQVLLDRPYCAAVQMTDARNQRDFTTSPAVQRSRDIRSWDTTRSVRNLESPLRYHWVPGRPRLVWGALLFAPMALRLEELDRAQAQAPDSAFQSVSSAFVSAPQHPQHSGSWRLHFPYQLEQWNLAHMLRTPDLIPLVPSTYWKQWQIMNNLSSIRGLSIQTIFDRKILNRKMLENWCSRRNEAKRDEYWLKSAQLSVLSRLKG